ncbi:MAG: 8-amino-7-oxononanoate synthase [Planctomycetota bacterium]|nr:8-amino-7-oxononanoate synthase [Planctomycetota bacterium]
MPSPEPTDPLSWIENRTRSLRSQQQFRQLSIRQSPHVAGQVQIAGHQLIDFGSNDYLSLSANPKLVDAVKANAGYVGWGSAASPLIHGRGTLHARLERDLAKFEQTEAALTFSSGFAANIGVIPAIAGAQDVIFSDAKNHASLIDGCRLSKAKTRIYPHNDIQSLRLLLEQEECCGSKLIVTDGLFSLDGDLARLPEIVQLAQQHGAMLLVDEAHATGVFGEQGTGTCEHFGVKQDVQVVIGTLSKACGSHGGFVAGTQQLIDWIANHARSYIFSTAVPDATCMASVTALELVSQMQKQRQDLLEAATALRQQLTHHGFNVGHSESQIIPVILGQNSKVLDFQDRLLTKGFFVPAIRPPSVPQGESLLRISLNSSHTPEMIDQLVEALVLISSETGRSPTEPPAT